MILRLRLSRLGRQGVTGRQEHDMIVLNDDLSPNPRVDTSPLAARVSAGSFIVLQRLKTPGVLLLTKAVAMQTRRWSRSLISPEPRWQR